MHTKKTKDRRDKNRSTDCRCTPSDFQEMFRKMRMCRGGQGDLPDCMDMMKTMMEMCCGAKTDSAKAEGEHKNRGHQS